MKPIMTRSIVFLLLAAGFASAAGEPAGPEERLRWFLGDEERNKALLPLIDQLDAESFSEREAASAKLAELPTFPAFARRLAKTDDRPEVRSRLRKLAELRPVEKESEELNAILRQIANEQVKGTLATLAAVVQVDVWTPNEATLERAARATVNEADLPFLHESLTSPSVPIRRLAAAAYGGLPPRQSDAPLRRLLDDPDDGVAYLAAVVLARRKDPACLATFARLLDATDFHTRHRSWSALKALSGKSFGFDPSVLGESRQAAMQRWRDWAASPDAGIAGNLSESSAIVLFNGRDLTGWEVYENGKPNPDQDSWEVRDDLLVSVGRGRGDIRTTARFENYVLSLQYMTRDARGDGGIGLMLTGDNEAPKGRAQLDGGSYLEVQLLPKRTGDLYLIGQFRANANGKPIAFSSRRSVDADDPVGQWNTLTLTVRDGDVEVALNGTIVNRATGGSKGPGRILLRNEGKEISYKNLLVHPLDP